jgi:alpha-glucosidase
MTNSLFRYRSLLLIVTFLLFALTVETRAAWRPAGDVRRVERLADGLVLTLSSGARVSITFRDIETVRVRLAPRGTFERDFSYAIESKDRKVVTTRIEESPAQIKMSSFNGTAVVIRRRPFLMTILDPSGRPIVEDDHARPTSIDLDTGAVETSKRRQEWEMYYGFGEKALPMSRTAQQIVMWNTDTYGYPRGLDPIYQAIGFFIALRQEQGKGLAYGVFLDNTTRTYFDMGKTDPSRYTFGAAGGELNYYVFSGGKERSPKNILRDYTDLTGRTPLPPLWALGNQQSRWSYFPEARVREIAKKFRETRTPLDVLYLDIDYMDGYRVFTWDKTRFPDPAKLAADLRKDGIRTVLIIDPGIKVDENYSVYKEGKAAGHFVKAADGSEFQARVWPGICAFPDFTDPKTREWFGSNYRKHLDEGIAGFWNDMNEPATFLTETTPKPDFQHHPLKTFPLTVRHVGEGLAGDHARYHNVYGMQMARSTFEGLRTLRPDERPFVLTRAGYAGVQRFSAIWTGDNIASWDHLRLSIPMLANLGVSGVAFVGADVGGFSENPSPELYTRWLQASTLTPFLRSHSEYVSKPHEPFAFEPRFADINRATIELRYKLLPYIYSLFREHTETGAPVMRPLWFEYPDDQRSYVVEDQYLLGRDLLVAPVVTEGVVKRRVYFPKGDVWVDWWTGQRHEGGKDLEVDAPLDRLPLFARAGATIPMQGAVQHTGEMASAPLGLVVVAGRDGSGSLYDDAGNGYEYRRGAYRLMSATLAGNTLRLKRTGDYGGARAISFVEFVGLDAAPREVRAGGRVAETAYDKSTRRALLKLPGESVEEIVIVPQ